MRHLAVLAKAPVEGGGVHVHPVEVADSAQGEVKRHDHRTGVWSASASGRSQVESVTRAIFDMRFLLGQASAQSGYAYLSHQATPFVPFAANQTRGIRGKLGT